MSNNNYPIYLHIGYPKAASTTFQSSLFYKNPNINDFSPYKAWKEGDKNILRLFNLLNKGGHKDEILSLFQEHIIPKLSTAKPNVFSSEFWLQPDNFLLKIEQLKLLFFYYEPKIIVITRNQYDLLKSLYYFLGGSFDGLEFNSLYNWFQFQIECEPKWLSILDFYQSLQYYKNGLILLILESFYLKKWFIILKILPIICLVLLILIKNHLKKYCARTKKQIRLIQVN